MKNTMTAKNHEAQEQSLVEHLIELRARLTYSILAFVALSCVAYLFAEDIYGFLVAPLAETLQGENRRLIYTGLTEAFFTYMKLAMFMGGFLAFPIVATQVWKFVAPGLYKSEKKAFLPFIIATPILFLMGAAFAYYGVFPMAWKFFAGFESLGGAGGLDVTLEARVSEYLGLVMKLIFAFGLCFQLPVLLTLMARAGLVTADSLAKKRKFALIGAFVIGAILTPPDVISQVALAIPVMLLYEVSIVSIRMTKKNKASP